MTHIDYGALNDYLDDALPPAERRAVEQHVMQCNDCSAQLTALRGLVSAARALPRTRGLSNDLWANVRGATVGTITALPSRRSTSPRVKYAAAAVALLVVSATIVLVNRQEPPVAYADNDMNAFATYHAAEADYMRAAEQLMTIIDQQRTTLDTAVIRTVEENVRVMDEAIGRARAALVKDPSSRDVAEILTSTQEAKMRMLRRAVATGET